MRKTLDWAKQAELYKQLKFKDHEKEFIRLAKEGQAPKALFIGCSDSRVLPEMFTSAKPGELFVVRNAGNFVPIWTPEIPWDGVAATILFAVDVLNVKEIIVCGHSHCGAIAGLFDDSLKDHPTISHWVEFGRKAKELAEGANPHLKAGKELNELTARLSVLLQLEHLLEYPSIQEKVLSGDIFLHGWYYTMEKGEIEYFDAETEAFAPLAS